MLPRLTMRWDYCSWQGCSTSDRWIMSCWIQMSVLIPLQISVYLENAGLEKHVCIQFCFKLNKNAMENFAMLQVALKSKQWEEQKFLCSFLEFWSGGTSTEDLNIHVIRKWMIMWIKWWTFIITNRKITIHEATKMFESFVWVSLQHLKRQPEQVFNCCLACWVRSRKIIQTRAWTSSKGLK